MKYLLMILTIFSQLSHAKAENKILIVLNDAFQPDEYFEPRKAFEREGFTIKTASRFGTEAHAGRKNTDIKPIQVDMAYDQINVDEFDGIVFVGGGGSWSDYFPNRTLHQVLTKAMSKKEMIVGLICAGTGLLATTNNFDGLTPQFAGRKVTGYGEVRGLLVQVGKLNYSQGDESKPHVVTDGNLITGRDPLSAKLFGQTIIRKILNRP